MYVGVPKEVFQNEMRVSQTPQSVQQLVKKGERGGLEGESSPWVVVSHQ